MARVDKREPNKPEPSGGPTATRRRGRALEDALLDAAWEELRASGYAHLTMERVADRAGTSRAVIYRRWRNRAELVVAALRHRRPVTAGGAIPDTGTLRGDLLVVMGAAARRVAGPGTGTFVGLLADLLADEASYEGVLSDLLRSGGELMDTILARAAARGEARSSVPERVRRLPLDLLRHEVILTHRPPTDEAIEEIIDAIFLPLVRVSPAAG
jgi:AcrR family transcriptional regulator